MNPLSALYGVAVARRNRRYDCGRAQVLRVGVPVISVGNISAGGTGKTPFVQYLVGELLALGRRPAVVSRGYGRTGGGEVLVSDGVSVLADVAQAGDELMLHAERLPVPVIANIDKAAGARTAVERFGVDTVVVDDGFQHRRLHRDCDIVLVDTATLDRPVLLPVGRLREPLSSLARADVLCCVGGVACGDLPAGPAATSVCIEAATLPGVLSDAWTQESVAKVGPVVAVAGIAHPERFLGSLAAQDCPVADRLLFGDHHAYRERDVQRMVRICAGRGCGTVATTEKDAVKLRAFRPLFERAQVRLVVLPVQTVVTAGRDRFLEKLVSVF